MIKKLVSSLLSIVILILPLSIRANAAPAYDKAGFISVKILPNGEDAFYRALLKNGQIYLTKSDIAKLAGYDMTTSNFMDASLDYFTRASGTDEITDIVINKGTACEYGGEFSIETTTDEAGTIFVNLEEMLYLMHAQWGVENKKLYIYPCGNTIFDFIRENYNSIKDNKICQSDLLMNGESDLGNSNRAMLAELYEEPDIEILVPYWGYNAYTKDEFKNALIQLAEPNNSFLDEAGQQSIAGKINDVFHPINTNWSIMTDVINMPLNTIKTTEGINKAFNANILTKFDPKNNFIGKDLSGLDTVATVLDYLSLLPEFIDVWTRSADWGTDYMNQLKILEQLETDNTYTTKDNADFIKSAASSLIDEYENPLSAAFSDLLSNGAKKVSDQLLGKALPPVALFEACLSISKVVLGSISSINTKIEDAADMNKTYDIIHTEYVALYEVWNRYQKFNAFDLDNFKLGNNALEPEDVQINSISQLRNSTNLLLSTVLYNQIKVYQYHVDLDKNKTWESSADAETLRDKIYTTYAWMIELNNTKDYDKLLTLGKDFSNMTGDEFGLQRSDITEDIFFEGDVPPKIPTANEIQLIYENFIKSNSYNQDAKNVPDNENLTYNYYAILDIDQNGIPELIIDSSDTDWSTDLIYSYDTATDKVVFIDSIYHYSGLRYSMKYKAIEYQPSRPDKLSGSSSFDTLDSNKLITLFSINMNGTSGNSIYSLWQNDKETVLSENEKDTYFSELNQIDFQKINWLTETLPLSIDSVKDRIFTYYKKANSSICVAEQLNSSSTVVVFALRTFKNATPPEVLLGKIYADITTGKAIAKYETGEEEYIDLMTFSKISEKPDIIQPPESSSVTSLPDTYRNDKLGFELTLPKSWEGLYQIKEYDDSVVFYNIKGLNAGFGGMLFELDFSKTQMTIDEYEDSTELIYQGQNIYVYKTLPNDVEYDYSNDKSIKEYTAMYDNIDNVIKTFRYFGTNNTTKNATESSSTVPNGFTGIYTVSDIRNIIVGSWLGYPNFYTFNANGTCTMFGDNKNKGTYRIDDNKTLHLDLPWMSETYEWNENSDTDKKGWCLTEYMLIIKGQECGRQ